MEDDDDYVDVDIDQIVQAHTSRGSGQVSTQPGPSQVGRTESTPVPAPVAPLPRSSGPGGLLPPYSNPYHPPANVPTASTPACNPYGGHPQYGGQPPRAPEQQNQQYQPPPSGSLFQRTQTAARGSNTPLMRLPPYNTVNSAAAAASSTSSGATAPATGGPGPPGGRGLGPGAAYQYQQQTSSTTSVGALSLSKPRSLGQQLGFGAPAGSGPPGTGMHSAAYGSYGAPFSISNSQMPGSTAGGGGLGATSHVTGTYGPPAAAADGGPISGGGVRGATGPPCKTGAIPPGPTPPTSIGAHAGPAAAPAGALGPTPAVAAAAAAIPPPMLGPSQGAGPGPGPTTAPVTLTTRGPGNGGVNNTTSGVSPAGASYTAGGAVAQPPGGLPPYRSSTGAAAASGGGGGVLPPGPLVAAQPPSVYPSQMPPGPHPGGPLPLPGLGGGGGSGTTGGSGGGGGGGGLYPGSVGGGGGSSYGGGGGCVAAVHAHGPGGPDVGALRAHNTSLEAQVEALKRQLQESAKVAQGAQSLQEQLQHVQAEAQELQRKHREASIRLQEERSRGETAERERKEAHDKCLLLEAELHKARVANAASSAAARTPPPHQQRQGGLSPGSGGMKRPRHATDTYGTLQGQVQGPSTTQLQHRQPPPPPGPPPAEEGPAGEVQQQQQERGAAGGAAVAPVLAATGGSPSTTTSAAAATPSPALLLTALDGLRAARLPLWQRLWCTCPDSLAVLLHPTAPATAAAAAAGEEEEEEEDGGSRGTAAAAAPCLAAGLMPLPGLHHTYQHRHVVLGGGSSSQLGPPGQMCPALLGGSLTGGGAGGGDGGDSDGGGSGSDHRTAVRGRCVALVEGVRVQLRALAGGRGDGTAVLLGVVAVLQAATGTCSEADAVAGGDGGGDRYRGSVPGSAASGGGPLQPPGEEAAAAGGDDTQPPHGGGGGGGEGGHDDEGPQGGDLGQSPQRRLEVGVGVEAAKVVARQRAALWPLVGPCVELLGGLLAHSEECRAAVGAATVESGGCGSAEASAPRPPPALPGEATTTTATAAATAVMTSSGASSHCVGGPLRWGSLPYLLLPLTGSHGCVAAAAAARAERRRHVRRFVYGSSSSSSQNGCLGASFDPGGSTAAYATLNANAQAAGGGQERPMGQQHEPKAALTTLAADGADPLIRGEGEEHGPGAAGRCDAVGGAAAAISAPLRDLVRLLMAVAACCNAEDDGGAEIAPAGPCSGAGGVVPHVDVLRCVAGALSSLGAVLPAASTRRALLPALLDPLHLLVPLMCRTATHTRLAATALLRLMMENPDCAAAAATALGVTGYTATAATTATTDNRASGPDAHHNRSSAPPSHDKVLEPAAAVQLFTALLDALDPESGCGEEGPGGWGRSEAAAGEQGWAGGSGSGWGGPPGASSPYDLPRQVLALLALLLDTGHEGLVGAVCCPPWLEGYGLPLRLLALADTACKPPGSEDPLEPVYPAPADPSLEIVAGSCVPPADWLQRLRAAQEALVLLKELLTGGSEDTRRAALDGLAPSSPDSDSPQLVELATSRLGAWARTPPELLQAALGPEAGFGAPVLAPWAARLVLSGGSGGAGRTGGVAGRGAGCNGVGGAGLVVCSVEAVGALAGSVRRRWEHWQLKQHQVWQQFNQQQLRQR